MYALSPKRSRNAVEKVESKLLNRVSGFGSNSKLFSKEKREKKKATIKAEMTNGNGGRNDRLEVRNGC